MNRACAVAVACLLAAPSLLPASTVCPASGPFALQQQDLPPGFRIERDKWEIPAEPGQSIQIENLHGDVRARRNGIPRLDVFAVMQLQEQDSHRADVQIIATPEGLRVDVRYVPKDPEAESDGEGKSELIRRIDLVAYIPSGSPLQIRTDDDLIEAREIESDIVAESESGDLTIIAEGSVRAKTSSGSILSVLLLDDPERFSLLETAGGDITVQVPDNLNVRVHAHTAGRISSEYPAEESSTEGAGPHEVVVRVGTGTHEARVVSKTGNIDIRAWRRTGQGGESR